MVILPGIEIIEGVGNECNIYIIDGEIVVDTGTGDSFPEIKDRISKGIRIIINTHCHFDHTGGNKKFRDRLHAEIAVHEKDKDAVETGQGTLAENFGCTYRTLTVDRKLRNGSAIKTKNFSFEVVHTPGHTPGSICLYDKKKKILISGDTLFGDSIGRTDLGGSKEQMKKSLDKLCGMSIEYLLPGHGPIKIGGIHFLTRQMANLLKEESFM